MQLDCMFKQLNACIVLKINNTGTPTLGKITTNNTKMMRCGNQTQIMTVVSLMLSNSVIKRNGAGKQGNHVPPPSQTLGAAHPIDFTPGFLPNSYFNDFD